MIFSEIIRTRFLNDEVKKECVKLAIDEDKKNNIFYSYQYRLSGKEGLGYGVLGNLYYFFSISIAFTIVMYVSGEIILAIIIALLWRNSLRHDAFVAIISVINEQEVGANEYLAGKVDKCYKKCYNIDEENYDD